MTRRARDGPGSIAEVGAAHLGVGPDRLELAVLAVTEFRGEHVGARREAHTIERGKRRPAQRGIVARIAPETKRMPGVRLDGEGDVVERGEIEKQRGDLKRAREPERAAP